MSRKIAALILVVTSLAFLIFGGIYVKKSGYFEDYPEAEYLTDEEEAERPAYSRLSPREQAVYTALYRGICEKKKEIALPFEIDGEMYSKLYCILEKQESELFYIDSSYYTAIEIKTATIMFREDSPESITEKENELAMTVDMIMSAHPRGGDDFEKALYIHDYIVSNCSYVRENKTGYASTVYGCLVEKSANCEGYAKAFVCLAREAGLNAVLVTGTTDDGENHAWNQVEIGGSWYNLDATWDDLDNSSDKRHTYLLCNDADFSRTHFADEIAGGTYPCERSEENYFVKMDFFVRNMDDADRILRREVALGAEIAELKFSDASVYAEFLDKYLEKELVFDIIMEYSSPAFGGNITIDVKENEKENCLSIYLK